MNRWAKMVLIVLGALAVGAGLAWGYVYLQNRDRLTSDEIAAGVNQFVTSNTLSIEGEYISDQLAAPATYSADVVGQNSETTINTSFLVAGKKLVIPAELRTINNKNYLKLSNSDEALAALGSDPLSRAIKNNLQPISEKFSEKWMLLDADAEKNDCLDVLSTIQPQNLLNARTFLAQPEYEKTDNGEVYKYQLTGKDLPANFEGCIAADTQITIAISFNSENAVDSLLVTTNDFTASIKQLEQKIEISEPKSSLKFSQLKRALQSLFIQ